VALRERLRNRHGHGSDGRHDAPPS
jgi:hypothetical protein